MQKTACLPVLLTLLLFLGVPGLVGCEGTRAGTDHPDPDGDPEDGDADTPEPCVWQSRLREQVADWIGQARCAANACMSDYTTVVSGRAQDQPLGLPDPVRPQKANNNLDVVSHDCRVFLAFRTGPSHFASADIRLYVVSSTDLEAWRYEGEFHLATDLREPRLLSFNGELFLYFAVLGENMWEFTPQAMMVSRYLAPGEWTEPQEFYRPGEGFIPWRTKVIDGRAHMITYSGGESIYEFGDSNLEVHWLTSEDGLTWRPVIEDQPVVLRGGSSETDFALLSDGSLVAVSRNESGEQRDGGDYVWGSKICRAPADDPGNWTCAYDLKKYDSPLVFAVDDRVFLIGRRHLTESGNYDLEMDELSFKDQSSRYQRDYWLAPKRTALWQVDPESLTVSFLMDLPSKGDTSFASLVRADERLVEIFNYSSPPDQEDDPSWVNGQTNPTIIYRLSLLFGNDPTGD